MKIIISNIALIFSLIANLNAVEYKSFFETLKTNPSPGYIFISPHISQQFYLVDNTGEPVLTKRMGEFDDFINPKLQPNGLISFFSGSKYYTMNESYEIVDSFNCVGDYEVDFHDFILLPNGNTAMLGREKRVMDLSEIVQGGQKNANVLGSIIQELDTNKNVIFHWSSFDHFQITDVTRDVDLTQNGIIVCHMNSIYYDTDGNIIASSRDIDEITKIDRNNGNIIWRLGGKECKNNQYRFLNDTIDGFYGFSHQHSATRLPNGNLLLFDNGDLKPKPYSRAVEYQLDEINKTIEKVWEYSENKEISTFSMGNTQRLNNGNTIIGWGLNTRNLTATEVKPDGTKVLELAGHQNYAIYKFNYKMNSVTLFPNQPGVYDFNLDTNNTNVKLSINNLGGEGDISVEKHYYQPHNLLFAGQEPYYIMNNRWILSLDSGRSFNADIKFILTNQNDNDSSKYIIYYRPQEGIGDFTALETTYNINENSLRANINGSGEFILGLPTSVMAPLGLFPPDSAKDVKVVTSFMWQPLSSSSYYRFQLSNNKLFSDLILDSSNITNTFLDLNLDYNKEYYWRVKAFQNDEQSPWSKSLMFVTSPRTLIIDENKNSDLVISKNLNNISIKFKNRNSYPLAFYLYDLMGNIVNTVNWKTDNLHDYTINIDLVCLNDGLFLYRIIFKDEIESGKLLLFK